MPQKPLQWYKALATRRGRGAAGAFLVEGPRAISQILQHQPQAILELLTVDAPPPALAAYPVHRLTIRQMRAISSTTTPQGLLAVVQAPPGVYGDDLPPQAGAKVLLLEAVQDPGNVGTLIRTAVAFDFSGVILTEKCADPLSPKCVQATAGTLFAVWLRRTPQYLALLAGLRQRGYVCAATDVRGDADPACLGTYPHLVLALGNEAAGLSQTLLQSCQVCVKIPISARAESLNVALCGAICMYMSGRPPGTAYGR